MFDPYYKWLGIGKEEQPPTHYRLLGIREGEADREVIEEAAVRQTTHLRTYQIGAHAAECTRILNEIARAKVTLLDPRKKKDYDAQLPAKSDAIAAGTPKQTPKQAPKKSTKQGARPALNPVMLWGGIAGGVLLVVGLAVAFWPRGERPADGKNVIAQTDKKVKSDPKIEPKIEPKADPKVEPKIAPKAKENYAMQFDGTNHVWVPTLRHSGAGPFTMECRVKPQNGAATTGSIACNAQFSGLDLKLDKLRPRLSVYIGNMFTVTPAREPLVEGQTYHLAGVVDGDRAVVFVDGEPVAEAPVEMRKYKASNLPFAIGGNPNKAGASVNYHFQGTIDELRFSKVARYRAAFRPQVRFEPDADTVALYHFDEGEGVALHDSSGNGHDGLITGPQWIKIAD